MPPERLAVLGIDAAWTDYEPSGVALLVHTGRRWCLSRLAASYDEFCGGRGVGAKRPDPSQAVDVQQLLKTSEQIVPGARIAVIAVDMPLARQRITTRRASDTAVSRRFGHCQCAVHSPTPARPGSTGRRLHKGFSVAGFMLATDARLTGPSLIEVYPHVALLGLTGECRRLPYKSAKTSSYWKSQPLAVRKQRLVEEWRKILDFLRRDIDNIDLPLPDPAEQTLQSLKRYEDALDGLICAWVGIQYLNDQALPLGDDNSAIWVPTASMKFAKDINGT